MYDEEILQIRLASFSDLTGSVQDEDRALPDVWIRALKATFEVRDEVVLPKRPKNEPADRQWALIPRTEYVVKVRPALWNLIKACAKAWSAMQFHQLGQDAQAALLLGAALESVTKLKSAFDKLDPNVGEYCTYISVIHSAQGLARDIGMYPSTTQVEKSHLNYRTTCTLTSCLHHKNGACAISKLEWLSVVNDLKKREILHGVDDINLWVTL